MQYYICLFLFQVSFHRSDLFPQETVICLCSQTEFSNDFYSNHKFRISLRTFVINTRGSYLVSVVSFVYHQALFHDLYVHSMIITINALVNMLSLLPKLGCRSMPCVVDRFLWLDFIEFKLNYV